MPRAVDRRPVRSAGQWSAKHPVAPARRRWTATWRSTGSPARLRALRRFGLDLCLGHIVSAVDDSDAKDAQDAEPVYIGRLGLTDRAGRRLLLDWRSPAAEPFFGATHANPMGLASRRRYRWTLGRISDYWDEVFTPDGFAGHAAVARRPVGVHRQPGQQPVGPDARRPRHHPGRSGRHHPRGLARARWSSTAVRAPARPSSHCTARRTCSTPTLASVITAAASCSSARTSRTWPTSPTSCPASARRVCRPAPCGTSSPRAPRPQAETDPHVAQLKASRRLVRRSRRPSGSTRSRPRKGMTVTTDWADVWLSAADWAEAFESTGSRYAAQRGAGPDLG